MKYKHLCFEERFVIEKLLKAEVKIREIAKFLFRSPNTISREIKKNIVNGEYLAEKANHRSYVRRWRSKRQCLKVAMNRFLCRFVEQRLHKKWSPEQISGYLEEELGIKCSTKAIYKFVDSRALNHLLFWGWNNQKSGRKKYQYDTPKDGRKYIEERPEVSEVGHFEMDFVVSKQSSWVFLVAVDRISRNTFIRKLCNRKRTTVLGALSSIFRGINVQSITTDNDIAFTCWREIETLLNTQVYFTHPYHSWEKGLVENTNRWIRCFVPKRRDISTVTDEEMLEILSFLNYRPRKVIGFKMPGVYDYKLRLSYLRG
jgi:transposase, IS30 family